MTSDALRSALLSRRQIIAAFGVSGVSLQDSQPASRGDVVQDLAAAERLLGLEFRQGEREQAKARVTEQRGNYEELRRTKLDWHLEPALRFDPLPVGAPLPPVEPGATWEPLAQVAEPTNDEELAFAGVDALAALLRRGKVSSRRLTELSLARLERFDARLLCVVTLLREEALAAADRADAEIKAGKWRSPLHGIPFGAKDLFAWPSAPTTFGARPYREQVWNATATVLQRLTDAGAVLVAKLSLGALAMGDVWFKGTTKNPWNPTQGSSGSSAGSAAAVAAGLVPFALGTETLGSIVSPCVRCGVTGLRTTFGTVSRYGAMPLSWSMDKIGPLARSAVDCALVFDAIRGPDGKDGAVRAAAFPWRRARSLEGLRIGHVQGGRGSEALAPFLAALQAAGAKLKPIELPRAQYRAMLLMLHAEGATAFDELTRDGGVRTLDAQGVSDWPNSFRSARFIPAVEYLRAARLRTQLIRDMAQVMGEIDAFVSLPQGGATLSCTNLTGHPCCVLPLALREQGAPSSVTVIGKLYGEADVLAIAEHWQRTSDAHRARPSLA